MWDLETIKAMNDPDPAKRPVFIEPVNTTGALLGRIDRLRVALTVLLKMVEDGDVTTIELDNARKVLKEK